MAKEPRDALVVGHPGHELRVHGWLSIARPLTFVLTDGSGPTGVARIASTAAILREADAGRGGVFGVLTDRAAYEAILASDFRLFCDLADAIAHDFVALEITSVAGDAWEGYNPVHDVCRLVIDAAVAIASRRGGHAIANWSFPLAGRPDAEAPEVEVRRLALDDAAFERKLAKADEYRELAADVAWAFDEYGRDAFRTEVLTRVVSPAWDDTRFVDETPFYETHGRSRVVQGKYARIIRYRDHVAPIAASLRRFAEEPTSCASF